MGAGGSTTTDSSPPPDAFSSLLTKDFSNGIDRGHVWAVNRDNTLLCGGLTAFLWTWSSVQGPSSSSSIIKIATNHMKSIWVVTSDNKLYFRKSHAFVEWEEIKFPGDCASVSAGAKSVWAIDAEGVVYFRTNVDVHSPSGEDWKKSEGRLAQISVSPSGQVIGTNKAGKIFFRRGVDPEKNPFGRGWEKISGMASGLSFGENIIWAWNKAGHVFYRVIVGTDRPEGKKWIKCEGEERMTSISAGSGVCYATDRDGTFHRRNAITTITPQGTDWQSVEEFHFSQLSASAAHSVALERSCATAIQEEMAVHSNGSNDGVTCNWLSNSTNGNNYAYTGAFSGSQVLYTWQMARRVCCLKRVAQKDDDYNISKVDDESDNLNSRLSPKALSALGDDLNSSEGNCVRVSGLGPILCDGHSDDPSCHFYCEFASNAMDWRGYLDTSVVYLRSVKTGKYLHIDDHTNLPHCNRTSGGNPCMITVKSNFDVGTVSIHFKHHNSASLSFGATGDPLKVKSIKSHGEDFDSSEDEEDHVARKLGDDDGNDAEPEPTLYVISIVDDGTDFRDKFMNANSNNNKDKSDSSNDYTVAID